MSRPDKPVSHPAYRAGMSIYVEPEGPVDDGGRASRIAFVMRELEQLANTDGSVAAKLARRAYPDRGPARVYSLRLGHAELAALEERAEQLGLRPSVLARNLVRIGLRAGAREDPLASAIDHLATLLDDVRGIESAAAEVRALLD